MTLNILETDRTLQSVFWMSGWQREQYYHYRDVVFLDTTFMTNKFRFPLAALVGMDAHGNTIVFALCLIQTESTESFEWFFQSLLDSVPLVPGLIFTDECKGTMCAINSTLHGCKHRLCAWHLERNLRKKILNIVGIETYKKIKGLFWHLVKNDMGELHVKLKFQEMITLCGENTRATEAISYLAERRELWVKFYSRGLLHFDKSSTSRVESINSLIKRTVYHGFNQLDEFIYELNKLLNINARYKAGTKDYIASKKQVLKIFNFLFCHNYPRELTPYAIKMIEQSVLFISQNLRHYTIDAEMSNDITRVVKRADRIHYVGLDENKLPLNCSCGFVDSWGLPCRHMCYIAIQESKIALSKNSFNPRWFYTKFSDNYMQLIVHQHSNVVDLTSDETSAFNRRYATAHAKMRYILNEFLLANKEDQLLQMMTTLLETIQVFPRESNSLSNNSAANPAPVLEPRANPGTQANKKRKQTDWG